MSGSLLDPDVRVADALTSVPHRVLSVRRESHDTVTLDLERRSDTIAFLPGQFHMLYAYGVGECAISISSSPDDQERLAHTVRAVGWVTRALAAVQPGATVGVRGPLGRPWPLPEARGGDLVIVAGGIGLAPVRPAIERALRDRDGYERLVLLVGARSPRDLVFRDDLDRWRDDPRTELHVTVDRPARGWTGRVGVVTETIEHATFDPASTTVFTCGPEVMMGFVAREFLARGVPADQLFVTLERNMRCGVGTCGHCQLGPVFVCRDGPVFSWPEVARLLEVSEL